MKLKKIIRKLKFLIYIFIAVIGVVLIIIACFINKDPNSLNVFPANVQYDILIAIGGSFASSAAATIFLLAILPTETDESLQLQEWGIKTLYLERNNIEIEVNSRYLHERLDFMAFGLSHFVGKNRDLDVVADKVKKGLIVRILTLNPYSSYVLDQEKLENNYNIKNDILSLIEWVEKVNDCVKPNGHKKNQIQIKFYDELPMDFYCRVDNKIYVGPYIPDSLSGKALTYQFDLHSKGGEWYSQLFERIWNNNSNIHVTDQCYKYHYIQQKRAIESILKYFCDRTAKGAKGEDIIGVIAIFKGDFRRTFFSCNKNHEEMHKIHKKGDGTVGVLIHELSDPNIRKAIVFNDYKNNVAFAKKYQTRKKQIKMLEKSAVKLDNNVETMAVLALPIINDSELLGVLTFDFVELPEKYLEGIERCKSFLNNPKKVAETVQDALETLFSEIEQCGDIVQELLGQEIRTEYKKLYEEEWNNVK